jgi:hypothetical protein
MRTASKLKIKNIPAIKSKAMTLAGEVVISENEDFDSSMKFKSPSIILWTGDMPILESFKYVPGKRIDQVCQKHSNDRHVHYLNGSIFKNNSKQSIFSLLIFKLKLGFYSIVLL